MANLPEAKRAQFAALRQAYEAEMPDKLALIGRAAAAVEAGGWQRADVQALYLLIHKLTGSAAIYGFQGVSRAAGDLEAWAIAALEAGLPEDCRAELATLVSALQSTLAGVRSSDKT